MNCKPGDLALIVSDDFPENVGKLVTVLRPGGMTQALGPPIDDFCWEVECLSPIRGYSSNDDFSATSLNLPGATVFARDIDLRPIRDSDGVDETLTWAGLPRELQNA